LSPLLVPDTCTYLYLVEIFLSGRKLQAPIKATAREITGETKYKLTPILLRSCVCHVKSIPSGWAGMDVGRIGR
jgi:hypothetical protein